jgi:hypothetical protein
MVDGVDVVARPRIEFMDLRLELVVGLRRVCKGVASFPRSFERGGSEIFECAFLFVFFGNNCVAREEVF